MTIRVHINRGRIPEEDSQMQTTLALEENGKTLPELLDDLQAGDEIILTRNNEPVAKLVGQKFKPLPAPRIPGLFKGMITLLHEDDEHLEGFREYME